MSTTAIDVYNDALAKLDRANEQIDELGKLLDRHFRNAGYSVTSRIDTTADEEIWSFVCNVELPRWINVRIGEFMHNLRSPLDQLVCALARQSGGSYRGVYFPFGADEIAFESQLKNKCALNIQYSINNNQE